MPACVWGERESFSNQHFIVVVPQPINFCILKKWANHSTWLIFPQAHLIRHFLLRHFLAKFSFHSSVHSQQSCRSGKLAKTGPTAPRRKVQQLIQWDFQREISDKYPCIVKSSPRVHHNMVMLPRILYHSCEHVWRCGWVFCSFIRTCALHLK